MMSHRSVFYCFPSVCDYSPGVTKALNMNSLTGVWGSFDLMNTDFSIVPRKELELNVTRTLPESCGLSVF